MCLYLKSITLEVIRQIAGIKRRIRFVRPSAGSVHFGRIMMCFCSQSVQLTKSPCCSGISEPSLLTFLLSIHSTSLQRASNTAKKNCTRPWWKTHVSSAGYPQNPDMGFAPLKKKAPPLNNNSFKFYRLFKTLYYILFNLKSFEYLWKIYQCKNCPENTDIFVYKISLDFWPSIYRRPSVLLFIFIASFTSYQTKTANFRGYPRPLPNLSCRRRTRWYV